MKIFYWLVFFVVIIIGVQQTQVNYFSVKNYLEQGNVNVSYGEINSEPPELLATSSIALATVKSLYFVGDIMLGRDVERRMNRSGVDYPYQFINFNTEDSFAFGNFEASIPEVHVSTPDNTFRFSVNQKFLGPLAQAGFTHLSLANNHAFDFGLPGYNSSISAIWNSGMVPFGHPSKLSTSSVTFIDTGTSRIAVIAIHTLFVAPSVQNIAEVLAYAGSESDLQIVYIHWGDEYSRFPSSAQRKLAQTFSDSGADIIIGHHPHVVQSIEKINETIVFYSLGNYIFDQYFSSEVQSGLVLKLDMSSSPKISLIPVTTLDSKIQPQRLEGEKLQIALKDFAKISDARLAAGIEAGVLFLDKKLASSTEVAIMAE